MKIGRGRTLTNRAGQLHYMANSEEDKEGENLGPPHSDLLAPPRVRGEKYARQLTDIRQWRMVLLIYSKSEREDLTREQLKTLKKIIEEKYP